jgi:hypothetical protein
MSGAPCRIYFSGDVLGLFSSGDCLATFHEIYDEGKGSLDNGYLDNLHNRFSNKYKKIEKIEKTL